ncbi:MAG: nucleoside-triphosphatase, partial [Nitrososphaeria archaeon]
MRIFITGLPGCGKTTLIKRLGEELKEKGVDFSGFITEEVRNKGVRLGFTIRDLKTEYELTFASVNEISQVKFHKYYLHMENFESIALNVFDNSNLILIDEIGKMEFYSYRFK